MEILGVLFFGLALVIGFFALLFGLARLFPQERLREVGSGLRVMRYNLWHMMAVVAVAALLLFALTSGPAGAMFSSILLCLLILAWFVRAWCDQFVFLMGMGDDDFPGRHDKLIWVFLLLAFAPIAVWFFKSYRLAHWPAPEPARLRPEPVGPTATQPA
jgi:hypothetical protein